MMKLSRLGFVPVLLGVGMVAGAALFSTRGGPVFAAQGEPAVSQPAALLQVDPPRTDGRESLAGEVTSRDLRTQMTLLLSRSVLDSVLADRAIAELAPVKRQKDPASWLYLHLQVVNLRDTSLLRVTMSPDAGASPKEQATLINAVVDRFILSGRVEQANTVDARAEGLERGLKQRMQRLEQTRNQLDSVNREIEVSLAERVPRDALAVYALELRKKHLEIQLEKATAETLLARQKERAATNQAGSEERTRTEDRLAVLGAREKVLISETDRIEKALIASSAGNSGVLERLRDEIRRHNLAIEKLEDRRMELTLQGPQESRIRVIDRATAP